MRVVVYESTKAADCEVSLKRVALIEDLILHKMVCQWEQMARELKKISVGLRYQPLAFLSTQ